MQTVCSCDFVLVINSEGNNESSKKPILPLQMHNTSVTLIYIKYKHQQRGNISFITQYFLLFFFSFQLQGGKYFA